MTVPTSVHDGDVPVVEEYWSGVLRRLQAEVDVFSRLIGHSGERGRENELAFARILESLVPRRYGVGTGLLLDSKDQQSRQLDVVIYDHAFEPTVLAQTTQLLHPIENVRACFEVKTRLDADSIRDAGLKKASVLSLRPASGGYPLFGLLAYAATAHPKTVAANLAQLDSNERPDLVCVLESGIVGGRSRVLQGVDGEHEFTVGLAALHERRGKQRLDGRYATPAEGDAEATSVDGVLYPVARDASNERVLAEPARCLLLFCEALLRDLAQRSGNKAPAITFYLSQTARQLLPLIQA